MPEDTTIYDRLAADADHWAPDVTVHDFTARDRVQFRKAVGELDPDPAWPYGRTPRINWPGTTQHTHWPEHLLEERRWWINHLYGDEGYTVLQTAETLALSCNTVTRDTTQLGIKRGKPGSNSPRMRALAERRAKVKARLERGLKYDEIAKELGTTASIVGHDAKTLGLSFDQKQQERRAKLRVLWQEDPRPYAELGEILEVAPHVIQTDMRAMRMGPRRSPKPVKHGPDAAMVDRAIHQLDEMAQFLLGMEGLELIETTPKQAKEWEQSLKRVSRVVSRIKRATKGEA